MDWTVMNTDDRIAELRAKTDPTEADLLELARLTGETLHAFPSPTALGVADANVLAHRENFRVIEDKRAQARRDGYALEVIALGARVSPLADEPSAKLLVRGQFQRARVYDLTAWPVDGQTGRLEAMEGVHGSRCSLRFRSYIICPGHTNFE